MRQCGPQPSPRRGLVLCLGLLAAMLVGGDWADAPAAAMDNPPKIDFNPMATDPAVPQRGQVWVYPQGSGQLLIEALEHPQVEVQLQAIDALLRMHRDEALSAGGRERFEQYLAAVAADAASHRRLRSAAVEALSKLGAVEALATALRTGALEPVAVAVADEALARAGHEGPAELWQARLADTAAPVRVRLSALEALAAIDRIGPIEAECHDLVTSDDAPITLRLAAAEALATAAGGQVVSLAETLIEQGPTSRLLAARLLSSAEGGAVSLLVRLVREGEDVAALHAAQGLLIQAPDRLRPLTDSMLERFDPGLRAIAAEVLAGSGTERGLARLERLLDDRSPQVRRAARRGLWRWAGVAEGDGEALLRQWLSQRLAADGTWREREQLALLAGKLEASELAPSVAALIEHDRFEVRRAAVWALRRLDDAGTWPAMRQRLQELVELLEGRHDPDVDPSRREGVEIANRWLVKEASQLIQTLAILGDDELWPMCQGIVSAKVRYVDQLPVMDNTVRRTATWALGWMPADHPQRGSVARMLTQRLDDESEQNPEDERVRALAAISLGRMGAAAHVETLEAYAENAMYFENLAWSARWALERITGEPMEPVPPRQRTPILFLTPVQ